MMTSAAESPASSAQDPRAAASILHADRVALLNWVVRHPGIRSSGTAIVVFSHLLFELTFEIATPRKISGIATDLGLTEMRTRLALRRLVEHGALRVTDVDERGVQSFTLARPRLIDRRHTQSGRPNISENR